MISYELLNEYKTNKENFEVIVHDVVGKGGGGVLRAVSDFPKFADYIYKQLPKIEKGSFDIFTEEKFKDKRATSFISKICHILNPRDYPIIYDNYNRKNLNVINDDERHKKLNEIIKKYKKEQTGKESLEDLYMIDSKLWAKGVPEYREGTSN